MKPFRIEFRKIRVKEYQKLRNTTNWNSLEDTVVKKALDADLFSVCLFDEDEIIGMGRVIGDGAIYFYIQDVIVLPEYRGKGVGKIIMENLENYIEQSANNNSFVGLMAAENVKDFYTQFGYLERPESRPGMYKVIEK